MITLLITGAFFLYEGIRYYQMKVYNPNLPNKLYAAAILAIILGIVEIVFGVAHFWF